MNENQDTEFNYKIIVAAMLAVIIGILIAFYYSHAQSKGEISFLQNEKELLMKDLALVKVEVDKLSALDQVYNIELEDSRFKIQQLLDSVGRLNFTISKIREYKTELRRLQAKNDSLKLKNDLLNFNNTQLVEQLRISEEEKDEIRKANAALTRAEALKRDQIQVINDKLKLKKYLEVLSVQASGSRVKSGRSISTNKASTIIRLNGSVVIGEEKSLAGQERVIYFQFLGPQMSVIEDNANTVNVNGNVYSKRVVFTFSGEQTEVRSYITVPEGYLEPGEYILNVFEDQRLLQTSDFQLK